MTTERSGNAVMNDSATSATAFRPTAAGPSFTQSAPSSAKNAATLAGSWLHQAAVHTSLNRLRSRRRREKRELTQALAERPAPPDDPARLAEVAEQRETVRHALTRLRPKAAAVLILRYSGLSYAEVGAALQVGTGQVGTLLRRAEQALKKELEVGTPV